MIWVRGFSVNLDEALGSPVVTRAAYKAYKAFQHIPGSYLSVEDFKQVGLMSAWRHESKLESMCESLLYTIVIRDMYDHARECSDFTRARLDAGDFQKVHSLDHWLEMGRDIKAGARSAYDVALGNELVSLLDDERCRFTPLQKLAAKLYFLEDKRIVDITAMLGCHKTALNYTINAIATKMRRVVLNQPWPTTGHKRRKVNHDSSHSVEYR